MKGPRLPSAAVRSCRSLPRGSIAIAVRASLPALERRGSKGSHSHSVGRHTRPAPLAIRLREKKVCSRIAGGRPPRPPGRRPLVPRPRRPGRCGGLSLRSPPNSASAAFLVRSAPCAGALARPRGCAVSPRRLAALGACSVCCACCGCCACRRCSAAPLPSRCAVGRFRPSGFLRRCPPPRIFPPRSSARGDCKKRCLPSPRATAAAGFFSAAAGIRCGGERRTERQPPVPLSRL